MEQNYGEKYIREEYVGKGAFGVVYKVRCALTSQVLIAKHVNIRNLPQGKPIKEFEILKQLTHPFIVRFIDSICTEDQLILIMEYCGERDLAHHIEKMRHDRRRFSQKLLVNWVMQLLLATQHMHSKKILHRDLKPHNIFLDSDLNLKVGDFGISKVLCNSLENARTYMGTPCYTAPEMYTTDAYSNKTDIWSLGCIMYEMCALERLFPLITKNNKPIGLFQVMQNVKNAPIPDIPSYYSTELRGIVKLMLLRDAEKRPSAAQLLQHPFLLQLMVNSTTKNTLKEEYSKHIKPTHSVQQYKYMLQDKLKALESDIHTKMDALKKKKLTKTQFNSYYKEIKEKTKQIQDTVKVIFSQMQGGESFVDRSESSIHQASNNTSDITIKSVDLSHLERKKEEVSQESIKEEEVSQESIKEEEEIRRQQQSMKTVFSAHDTTLNETLSKTLHTTLGKIAQANLTLKNISDVKNMNECSDSKDLNSLRAIERQISKANTVLPQKKLSPPTNLLLGQTLKSDYFESTLKSDTLNYTLNSKQPNKQTNNNTLNGTLLSSLLTNTLKEQEFATSMHSSMNGNLDTGSISLSKTLASEKANNMSILKDIIAKAPKEIEEEYEDDFEPEQETGEDISKREKELNDIKILYREMLLELDRPQSTESERMRDKYLVMSQIKEQSGESGSVINSNASRETFSPLMPQKSQFSKNKLSSTK